MLHSHLYLAKFEAIIISSAKGVYFLPDSLLEIIIKGSFTENFHPSQAFSSDEKENFYSSVVGYFKNKALPNGFFNVFEFVIKMLYIEKVVQLYKILAYDRLN